MQMPDVNVLVYTHREESPNHERYAKWLMDLAKSPEPFAISEFVIHGFLRIVSNARIFDPPSTLKQAFAFLDAMTELPTCAVIRPGERHFAIFRKLCETGKVKSKLVADAIHAALAIESGCEWVTADTDFARFVPALRWRHLS